MLKKIRFRQKKKFSNIKKKCVDAIRNFEMFLIAQDFQII